MIDEAVRAASALAALGGRGHEQAYAALSAMAERASKGTPLNRNNIRTRVVGKAVERANAALVKAVLRPIPDGITNHSLRRTFASLLYEAGASPAYVMSQMGHTSSALALEVYAKKMAGSRDTGARMDALIRGADWAPMGTNEPDAVAVLATLETETAQQAVPSGRGWDRTSDLPRVKRALSR